VAMGVEWSLVLFRVEWNFWQVLEIDILMYNMPERSNIRGEFVIYDIGEKVLKYDFKQLHKTT